jgi:hypothetical protein
VRRWQSIMVADEGQSRFTSQAPIRRLLEVGPRLREFGGGEPVPPQEVKIERLCQNADGN